MRWLACMGYAAGRGVVVGGRYFAVKPRRRWEVLLLGSKDGHKERLEPGIITWYFFLECC